MTLRLRQAQQDRLARDSVGRFLQQDLAAAFGEASFSTDTGRIEYGAAYQRGRMLLDTEGRIVQSATPLQRVTHFDFADGRLAQVRSPASGATRFSYDRAGCPATVERHDGAIEQFTFSAEGDLRGYLCADGSSLRFDYDQRRKLTKLVERTGGERRWEYDDQGRLASIQDPLGRATRFEYTSGELPSRISHAGGVVEDFRYEGQTIERRVDGRPHSKIEHDGKGRVARTEYADGVLAAFSFDAQDRLVEAALGEVTATFIYDKEGRLALSDAAGRAVSIEYLNGGVSRIVLPDGRAVSYEYDADGRLAAATDWQGNRQHFSYGASERPIARYLPNGLVEQTRFDSVDRVGSIELGTSSSRIWLETFEYDKMDRVVSRDNNRDGRRNFSYDEGGQLAAVRDAAGATIEAFAYDASGNRVYCSRPGAPSGEFARYDEGDRAVSAGNTEYGFDARGNRAWARNAAGTTRYRYDLANHLVGVTHPDGSTTEYTYDAFSRRMSKRRGELLVEYVWSGHQLVQELVTQGADKFSREFMYWPGEHRPLAMCSRGQIYFYHLDHLGTPQFLTDASGAVVWSARYEAYGAAHEDIMSVDQPLRFLGQYFDAETGLHYNRARYYDPALGSYLSLDPGLPVGSANLYRYVAGNPINLTDPFGLFGESWPGWVKTGVSIAASVAVVGVAVLLLPAELPILAAVAVTVAVGAAAGAAGFGVSAAMTEGGCVTCAMKEGAVVGAIGALPFVAALFVAAPAGICAMGIAGIGAASGAISYAADWYLYDRPWSTKDFALTVVVSAATAGLFKYVGGKISSARGAGESGGAAEGNAKGSSGDTATTDTVNSGDRDTVPIIKEPPPKPPADVPPPKTGEPYADRATEMTGHGQSVDSRYPVKIYTPEELAARRVVPTDDGRLVFAESGKPVDGNKIYVMDKAGNVYADDPVFGEVHHSSLAGGEKPAGAGHMTADNGRLLHLDDSSGHFGENLKPNSPDVVRNELASQGTDVSQTTTSSHGDVGPAPPLPPLRPVAPGPDPAPPGPSKVPISPGGPAVAPSDDGSGMD